jgi:hypothetical protein
MEDEREAVLRILGRIAESKADGRAAALAELMVLAGLRRLGPTIERETEQMPILDDIMDHEVLGRERKRGIALGRAEALEAQRRLVLRQIEKRFGSISNRAEQTVSILSARALEDLALRLLDAASLEELVG